MQEDSSTAGPVVARRANGRRDHDLEARIEDIADGIREEVESLREEVQSLRSKKKQLPPIVHVDDLAVLPFLKVQDVAAILQVSSRTVDIYSKSGEIPPPVYVGGAKRWDPEALLAHIRSNGVGEGVLQ